MIVLFSCKGKKDSDEIHDLINQTILDQYRDMGTILLENSDTIIIDSFLIDPCASNGFLVVSIDSALIQFNNSFSDSLKYLKRYFTSDDIIVRVKPGEVAIVTEGKDTKIILNNINGLSKNAARLVLKSRDMQQEVDKLESIMKTRMLEEIHNGKQK